MMQVDLQTGILRRARQCLSENYNERPQGGAIDLLVIHCISLPPGQYGSEDIDNFFCNQLETDKHEYFQQIRDMKVSTHLLIRRDGELVQYVPFNKRAWHAGQSSFKGRDNCNDFSIGIELEGIDTDKFTPSQYNQLVSVTKQLMRCYPEITRERIVGHSDIAPGRKTDPGLGFDWDAYRQALFGTHIAD